MPARPPAVACSAPSPRFGPGTGGAAPCAPQGHTHAGRSSRGTAACFLPRQPRASRRSRSAIFCGDQPARSRSTTWASRSACRASLASRRRRARAWSCAVNRDSSPTCRAGCPGTRRGRGSGCAPARGRWSSGAGPGATPSQSPARAPTRSRASCIRNKDRRSSSPRWPEAARRHGTPPMCQAC